MHGILNIKKEKGYTSHDVVAIVRKTLQIKKVGHTGTLDPDAEGVLPICIGKATKLSDNIMRGDKTYIAVLELGKTTTTQDASGEVLEERAVEFDEKKIEKVVKSFLGEREQIPPMYSAIRVNGKRLYELAREGKEVERKSRMIRIIDIQILKFLPPNQIEIEVKCTKGTYIRTICADIGEVLGCGGHMVSLVRTATGRFSLDKAITLEQLKKAVEEDKLDTVFQKVEDIFKGFPCIVIKKPYAKWLYNGAKLPKEYWRDIHFEVRAGQVVTVFDYNDVFMGLYHIIEEEGKQFVKPYLILHETV